MVYPFAVIDNVRVYPFWELCKLFFCIGNWGANLGANLGNGERGSFHRGLGNLGSLLLTIQE